MKIQDFLWFFKTNPKFCQVNPVITESLNWFRFKFVSRENLQVAYLEDVWQNLDLSLINILQYKDII